MVRVSDDDSGVGTYPLTVNSIADLPEWTILVYIAGDNNFETWGIRNINRMEAATLSSDLQVGVLLDRIQGYDTSNGGWTDTRVGVIQHDSNSENITSSLVPQGEWNTGSPATLLSFLNWGALNLPAKHYALVLEDHGGAIFGSCWDDTSARDNLTLTETAAALAWSQVQISVLGFNACDMATAEVVQQVSPYVDYVVASEDTEWCPGWDYTAVLNSIVTSAAWTPQQLAGAIVQDAQNNARITTLSATTAASPGFFIARLRTSSTSCWPQLRRVTGCRSWKRERGRVIL